MKQVLVLSLFLFTVLSGFAQQSLTGALQANTKFFMRDTAIDAGNDPLYDNLLSGSDVWLNMNYVNLDWDFSAGVRLDIFNNSNLHDPKSAYSEFGIGRYYFTKRIDKLKFTAGHFYNQIGRGLIFRAYEERSLGIDNALYGAIAEYQITDNLKVKGFTGKQRNRFDTYEPIIKGASIEWFRKVKNVNLAPGAGIVNRTLDQTSMNSVINRINSLPLEERFIPKFNVYAYTLYNNLVWKNFTLYTEGALKSSEAVVDPADNFENSPGNILFTSLTYAKKGFGVTGQFKRTEKFVLRTSTNETGIKGLLNFLPPLTRQNGYTLTARYNAATQDYSELAYRLDIVYKPWSKRKITFESSVSHVTDLDGNLLFDEVYIDATIKHNKKWKFILGNQFINYNQLVFEGKGSSLITAITPFVDVAYKISRRKSIRVESQVLLTDQDKGSWINLLAEYTIAPKWSFSLSDMYNFDPVTGSPHHYPTVFMGYNAGPNKFTLSYVKQVEGIVCTGGVCRIEPAFSGVRFTLNTTF